MVNHYRARGGAYTVSSYVRTINALYNAGHFSYKLLQKMLKSSPSQQKKFVAKYSKKGMKSGEIKNLKSKVREIAKVLENNTATSTFRKRDAFKREAAVNAMSMDSFTVNSTTILETSMANLRYYDAATNALVTADPSVGTFQRDITVKEVYAMINCRNNYQVPCKMTIYAMVPKKDTGVTPATFFTAGLADQGNPTATSPLVHLTDSEILKENWKIAKSVSKQLNPGQELSCSWSHGKFEYDFSNVDTHALAFQKIYGGMVFLTRLEGVIGHDSVVTTEQGYLPVACDCEVHTKWVFEYDAGKDLQDIFIDDNADTFTNGGLISNKPVSDNQAFSLA